MVYVEHSVDVITNILSRSFGKGVPAFCRSQSPGQQLSFGGVFGSRGAGSWLPEYVPGQYIAPSSFAKKSLGLFKQKERLELFAASFSLC